MVSKIHGRKLPTPRLSVTLPGADEPFEVQAINADLVLWDRAAARHKWPDVSKAPFLWLTFIAWAACRRDGVIPPDMPYETFEETTLAVENLTDDDDEPATVSPTEPDHESGY